MPRFKITTEAQVTVPVSIEIEAESEESISDTHIDRLLYDAVESAVWMGIQIAKNSVGISSIDIEEIKPTNHKEKQ